MDVMFLIIPYMLFIIYLNNDVFSLIHFIRYNNQNSIFIL